MKVNEEIYKKVTDLILQGCIEDASKEFFNSFENEIIAYIKNKLRWNHEEAYSIFHDAYLLVQEKILEGEIKQLNKLTVLQTCKYIGANKYRKAIKEKEKLDKYYEEERMNFYSEYNNYLGIKIDEEEEGTDNNIVIKALRAFSLLKEQCQKLLVMKYLDGHSHQLIVQSVPGITNERSSITILSRCVKKWKEFFNKM